MLVRLKSLKSGIQSHDCSHFPKAPFEEEVLSFVDSTLSSKLQLPIYCINRSQKILCIHRHILYMPPPTCMHPCAYPCMDIPLSILLSYSHTCAFSYKFQDSIVSSILGFRFEMHYLTLQLMPEITHSHLLNIHYYKAAQLTYKIIYVNVFFHYCWSSYFFWAFEAKFQQLSRNFIWVHRSLCKRR